MPHAKERKGRKDFWSAAFTPLYRRFRERLRADGMLVSICTLKRAEARAPKTFAPFVSFA